MPLRYSRKIIPDRVPKAELRQLSDDLYAFLRTTLEAHLKPDHGWVFQESEVGLLEAKNATFTSRVKFQAESDMRADGSRFHYIQVSLSCMNHRRAEADAAEVATTEGFQQTFALIGACVIGIPVFLVQVLFLRRISLLFTAIGFGAGWLGGGLVGYMMGSSLGSQLKKQKGKMSFDDEVDHGVARADWESFLETVIAPIDQFAERCESTPSKATVV